MPKAVYIRNGVVVNLTDPPGPNLFAPDQVWIADDSIPVSVGDTVDPRDPEIDAVDVATFRALFRHENLIRELIRTIRTNSQLNTAATTNGLPTTANSSDLTLAQARDAFKALLP